MKRADILSALVALTVSLHSLPVIANDGGHGASKASLPQLDVGLYPGLLFWMGLSFFILFLVMHFVGVPGIKATLDKRQNALNLDLSAARAANEEAKSVITAYETALTEARRQAHQTVAGIIQAASKEANDKQEKQQQELMHRMVVAEENIATARQAAMSEAPKFVNDLVQDIAKKVTAA